MQLTLSICSKYKDSPKHKHLVSLQAGVCTHSAGRFSTCKADGAYAAAPTSLSSIFSGILPELCETFIKRISRGVCHG